MSDHIKRITVETEADIPADVVKDVLETVMVKLGSCWSELTKGPVHDETGKHVANVSVRNVPIDLQMSRDLPDLDDAVVVQAREAILDDLRDRRLLKYLFAERPEDMCAYGRVEQPLDLEVQHEIAERMARISISADRASRPVESQGAPTPAADEVEAVARAICDAAQGEWRTNEGLTEQAIKLYNPDALNNHWRHEARAAIAAMQTRSAEPASDPCKLPAEPAGEEPVAACEDAQKTAVAAGEAWAACTGGEGEAELAAARVIEAYGDRRVVAALGATPTNKRKWIKL